MPLSIVILIIVGVLPPNVRTVRPQASARNLGSLTEVRVKTGSGWMVPALRIASLKAVPGQSSDRWNSSVGRSCLKEQVK